MNVMPFVHPHDHERAGLRDYLPRPPQRRRRRGALMVVVVTVLIALVIGARLSAAPPAASVDVLPRRAFSGADLRATVHVEPDAANRRLITVIDGPNYYSRSDEQLAGADAPRTRERMFLHLPQGHYVITAVVVRADGRQLVAHEEACFLGPTEDCQ
jgi:hypothetical protein